MQFGPNAHPLFARSLGPANRGGASLGVISYYIHEKMNGWKTRICIFNYFSFLTDSPVQAEFEVLFHDRDGRIVERVDGRLPAYGNIEFDCATLNELDEFGVVDVHISPLISNEALTEPYGGVFFTEYYLPSTERSIFAHSLGTPITSHFSYTRLATGLHIPKNFNPYLFIASGCSFQRTFHPKCARAELTFINSLGKELSFSVPGISPRGCLMLPIFEMWPILNEHLGQGLFSVKISGQNILSKPYLFQTFRQSGWGEHL